MDPGSGALEIPADGSPPQGPPEGSGPIDLGLPRDVIPDARPMGEHHVVVAAKDRDLLDDIDAAGSSPTLIRDPMDLEDPADEANPARSATLIRDPLDLSPPAAEPSTLGGWWPWLAAALLIGVLVFTCGLS